MFNVGMNEKFELRMFVDYDFEHRNSVTHLKEWYEKNIYLLFKPIFKKFSNLDQLGGMRTSEIGETSDNVVGESNNQSTFSRLGSPQDIQKTSQEYTKD